MVESVKTRSEIASVEVVEPLPQLRVHLRDPGAPEVVVDGMPASVAMEIPWGPIIDKLGDLIFGGGGGGGGGGCTTIKITNADGSSTEIKQCPPPKTA